MNFLWEGLKGGVSLIVHGDPATYHLLWVTIEVALVSTAIALVIGLPIGLVLGLGRFWGRRFALSVANAGLGLPPVVVGIMLAVLMLPQGPLGSLHLIFTPKAMYVAQTVLALPIVIALSAAAVQSVPSGLLDQARAFGAGSLHVSALALRESRVGVFAAAIAAVGSALSEVGALAIVGGNIVGSTQTLAVAALTSVNAGGYSFAIAIGIILLGLILLVSAALTFAQQRGTAVRLRAYS
jgi:tungstate transport system permease protein